MYANKLLTISAVTLFSLPAVWISPYFVTAKIWGVEYSVNKVLSIDLIHPPVFRPSRRMKKAVRNTRKTCLNRDTRLTINFNLSNTNKYSPCQAAAWGSNLGTSTNRFFTPLKHSFALQRTTRYFAVSHNLINIHYLAANHQWSRGCILADWDAVGAQSRLYATTSMLSFLFYL